jgi:hypothetical protein
MSSVLEEALIRKTTDSAAAAPRAFCCRGAGGMGQSEDAASGASGVKVQVESGRRLGMRYDLFQPEAPSDRNCSALVLVHGFGCNRTYMKGHARRLASAGASVMTPNVYFMPAWRQVKECKNSLSFDSLTQTRSAYLSVLLLMCKSQVLPVPNIHYMRPNVVPECLSVDYIF